MNSIVDACLKSINDINENEFIAEMNAFDALLENYNKMLCLMEYDTSRVFVEAEVAQNPPPVVHDNSQLDTQTQNAPTSNIVDNTRKLMDYANGKSGAWEFNPRPDKKDGSGKENIIISILAFIPRLLLAVIKFIGTSIKNLFSGKNQTEQALNNVSDKLDATPDAFKTWALNEDNLAKLIREASGEQNWNLSFKISPTNFKNSAEFDSGKTDKKGRTLYEVWVYPPISVDTVKNNLSAFITQVLDPLTKTINDLFIHKVNDEGRQGLNQLKKEDVDKLNNIISKFKSKVRAENEIAKATKETQKSTKNLIVDVKGNRSESETTLAYAVKPGTLYDNLGKISQIIQVMSKRVDGIETLLKKYQESSNKMAPDSPETLENFKKSIGSLKDVASDIITQVRFLSDLATDMGRDAGFVAKQFDNAFNKWQQSNGESGETNQEVNNDTAADNPTNTNNIPGNTGGNVNNDAAAEGAEQKPGFFNRMGTAISNTAANVKNKVADLNTQRIVAGNEKAYQSFAEKYGKSAPAELQVMYPGTKEFTKLGEAPEVYKLHELINKTNEDRPGSKIRIIRKPDGINEYYFIDENNEKVFITEQDLEGLQDNIEIITEQDYLMYYQFENITSLEF